MVQIIVNGELKSVIYPPSSIKGKVWDLGYVNSLNGELMAINAVTNCLPNDRLDLCHDYLRFYDFIYQKANPKSTFGFDKFGVKYLNDTLIQSNTFIEFLEKALKPLTAFTESLVKSISDMFDNVSFNLLMRLLELHPFSSSEMEYSKTLTSPWLSTIRKKEFSFLKTETPSRKKWVTDTRQDLAESQRVKEVKGEEFDDPIRIESEYKSDKSEEKIN